MSLTPLFYAVKLRGLVYLSGIGEGVQGSIGFGGRVVTNSMVILFSEIPSEGPSVTCSSRQVYVIGSSAAAKCVVHSSIEYGPRVSTAIFSSVQNLLNYERRLLDGATEQQSLRQDQHALIVVTTEQKQQNNINMIASTSFILCHFIQGI